MFTFCYSHNKKKERQLFFFFFWIATKHKHSNLAFGIWFLVTSWCKIKETLDFFMYKLQKYLYSSLTNINVSSAVCNQTITIWDSAHNSKRFRFELNSEKIWRWDRRDGDKKAVRGHFSRAVFLIIANCIFVLRIIKFDWGSLLLWKNRKTAQID